MMFFINGGVYIYIVLAACMFNWPLIDLFKCSNEIRWSKWTIITNSVQVVLGLQDTPSCYFYLLPIYHTPTGILEYHLEHGQLSLDWRGPLHGGSPPAGRIILPELQQHRHARVTLIYTPPLRQFLVTNTSSLFISPPSSSTIVSLAS
jgi:hypothetical protein